MKRLPQPSCHRGFSLVETSIAIGLFGLMIPPVLMLVFAGTREARASLDQERLTPIRGYLSLRLAEGDWPATAARGKAWTHEIRFNREGAPLVGTAGRNTAAVNATLHATPAPHLPDAGLEQIRVEFHSGTDRRRLGTTTLQRHRAP